MKSVQKYLAHPNKRQKRSSREVQNLIFGVSGGERFRTKMVDICMLINEYGFDSANPQEIVCDQPIETISYKIGVNVVSQNGKPCTTVFNRLAYKGSCGQHDSDFVVFGLRKLQFFCYCGYEELEVAVVT
jgi:hypothetical protein